MFKRIILSASLLVIAAAAIISGMLWLNSTVNGLNEILDRATSEIESGGVEKTAQVYEEFEKSFEKSEKYFSLLVHDNVIDEISILVIETKELIDDGDTEKIAANLKSLRDKIDNIWDSVIPTAENIF